MLKTRVIPCLLLENRGLVKTVKFANPAYVGDPINAIKIFNEKEVDELIFLDIAATRKGSSPPFKLIADIASECFMPLCYGGGIRSLEDIKKIFDIGAEKVSINSCAIENPSLVREAAGVFGSQSIVAAIDVKKSFLGKYEVYTHGGKKNTGVDPVEHARRIEEMGAGEIFLNSINNDGAMKGYDLELIRKVSSSVNIPVIACGGAGNIDDFVKAVNNGASAVSAGSMFVFHGRHRAVLITYPSYSELENAFSACSGAA